MAETSIEWTQGMDGSAGKSWNPIRARNRETGRVGWFCTKPSPGCKFCYAERMNQRTNGVGGIGNGVRYAIDQQSKVEIFLDEEVLREPLRWKKPRNTFVCSMTDLFGEWVPDEWLNKIYAVMALCSQHTFMVLTKRPQRRLDYLLPKAGESRLTQMRLYWVSEAIDELFPEPTDHAIATKQRLFDGGLLANVWEGTSVVNQEEAERLIPITLLTPASIRWISAEPLLGPIKFLPSWVLGYDYRGGYKVSVPRIDWSIVGGESGPGARECHLDWISSIVEQCKAASLPCFVKQLGRLPVIEYTKHDPPIDAGRGKTKVATFTILGQENRKGADINEWPAELRVRQFPEVAHA